MTWALAQGHGPGPWHTAMAHLHGARPLLSKGAAWLRTEVALMRGRGCCQCARVVAQVHAGMAHSACGATVSRPRPDHGLGRGIGHGHGPAMAMAMGFTMAFAVALAVALAHAWPWP